MEGNTENLADRLRPVLLRLGRRLRREIHDPSVTATGITLLGAICARPGIGPSELADRERMTGAALSVHLDRLEEAGLIERVRDGGDRRRVGLHGTERGAHLLAEVRSRRTAWLAERLRALAPEDLAAIDAAVGPLQHLIEEKT